ncbi:MAG: transporter permease protein, partial [Symbiobacteriaceae bacterium]|nr:transporter permease protein [Symbiobacteriaceae bacterium]
MRATSARAFAKHCDHCATPPRWTWWDVRRPGTPLLALAVLVSVAVGLPILYMAVRAGQGGAATWQWLLSSRLPGILGRTLGLGVMATALALAISVPLAWLVSRTDLPGRGALTWVAAMPLVFPPYVGAFAYLSLFGEPMASVPGAAVVLALFTYPYIYLLIGSALRGGNQSLEEAARSSGATPAQVFWRVTLPLLRPALVAGALLVALYALSDFGAVAMLRVETFTSAIYLQIRGRFDRSAAAALSMVLVILTLVLIWLEERMQSQGARYYTTGGQWKPVRPVALGRWKVPATLLAWGLGLGAVGVPAGMLAYWSVQGLSAGV